VYTQSPFFSRVTAGRFAPSGRVSWLWLAPGVSLILLALAILIWPELLAYMVAGALLMVGVTLTAWGWTMRQAARRPAEQVRYEVYRG
jgi:hypothetical protein